MHWFRGHVEVWPGVKLRVDGKLGYVSMWCNDIGEVTLPDHRRMIVYISELERMTCLTYPG
jgi:hypothetical protein